MKANIGLAAAAGIAMLAASATTGAQIVLYEHDNYSGRSVQATNSVSNLADSGFNDQASSVIVRNGRWQICSDANFAGNCHTYGPGDYPNLPSGQSHSISSGRRVSGNYPYRDNPNWGN